MRSTPTPRTLEALSAAISNEVDLPEGPDLWHTTTELWFARQQLGKFKKITARNQEQARRIAARATVPQRTDSEGRVLTLHTPNPKPAHWTIRGDAVKEYDRDARTKTWERARVRKPLIKATAPKDTPDIGWPAGVILLPDNATIFQLEKSMRRLTETRAVVTPVERQLKERMTVIAEATAEQAPHLWDGAYRKLEDDGWVLQTWQLTFNPALFAEQNPDLYDQLKEFVPETQPEGYFTWRTPKVVDDEGDPYVD